VTFRTLKGYLRFIFGMAFLLDGRLVASASVDKTVRL